MTPPIRTQGADGSSILSPFGLWVWRTPPLSPVSGKHAPSLAACLVRWRWPGTRPAGTIPVTNHPARAADHRSPVVRPAHHQREQPSLSARPRRRSPFRPVRAGSPHGGKARAASKGAVAGSRLPSQLSPDGLCRGPRTGNPLRLHPTPSCTAGPGCAKPHNASLQATAAGAPTPGPHLAVSPCHSQDNGGYHDVSYTVPPMIYQLTACEQAEKIVHAALALAMASKTRKGDVVRCLDHFDMLQSPTH